MPRRVEALFHEYAPVWAVKVAGRVIRTTGEHPFYVQGKGWGYANALQIGDALRAEDGRWLPVEAAGDTGEEEAVYNCRIAGLHTYFVGQEDWAFAVWAHNSYTLERTSRASGIGGDFSRFAAGVRRASERLFSYTNPANRMVKASVDGLSRWWVLEAKYAARTFKDSYYASIAIGSSRHYKLRDQFQRLLGLADAMGKGKKGVRLITTSQEAVDRFRMLLGTFPDLKQAIDAGRITFQVKNWWKHGT